MRMALALLLSALLLAACGSSSGVKVETQDGSYERVKKAGVLAVGLELVGRPMAFAGPDGKPAGFEPDLATELTRRLGVKVEFVVVRWDGVFTGLKSGRYDLLVAGPGITDARLREAALVEYLAADRVFVGKRGISVQSLAGKVVAVEAESFASDWVEDQARAGLVVKTIKPFKGAPEALAAAKAGQADLVVLEEPTGRHFVQQDPTLSIAGKAGLKERFVLALRKDEKDLNAAVARAMEEMKQDGTWKRLQEQWFGSELSH